MDILTQSSRKQKKNPKRSFFRHGLLKKNKFVLSAALIDTKLTKIACFAFSSYIIFAVLLCQNLAFKIVASISELTASRGLENRLKFFD